LDTELGQAVLLSKLSGRPAPIFDDVFAWNGKVMDRSTAVIALLKVYNHVPVGDNVKVCAFMKYYRRFEPIEHSDFFVGSILDEERDLDQQARFWFSSVCRTIRGEVAELSADAVKQILITLHS
jgi:hypothetical protein